MLRAFQVRDDTPLYASLPGLQVARIDDLAARVRASGGDLSGIELRLGGAARSISGRVLDTHGEPLAGWRVELRDGTRLNPGILAPEMTEHPAGGRDRSDPVITGRDGSFRIDGLYDRDYVLDAWTDWRDAVAIRSEPIAAGTEGVVLRLEERPWIERMRGRVVDPSGLPVADAAVELRLDLPLVIQGYHNSLRYPAAVRTDADGRFELERAPRRYARLVGCSACELIAYRDGAEIARRVIELAPGRVTTVTLDESS